jgi:hypothetical protein
MASEERATKHGSLNSIGLPFFVMVVCTAGLVLWAFPFAVRQFKVSGGDAQAYFFLLVVVLLTSWAWFVIKRVGPVLGWGFASPSRAAPTLPSAAPTPDVARGELTADSPAGEALAQSLLEGQRRQQARNEAMTHYTRMAAVGFRFVAVLTLSNGGLLLLYGLLTEGVAETIASWIVIKSAIVVIAFGGALFGLSIRLARVVTDGLHDLI